MRRNALMARKKFSTRWHHLYFFRVMRGVSGGALAQRDDRLDACAGQAFAQPAGIEGLVADESQAGDAGHENIKAGDVVTLPRQEPEAYQIPTRRHGPC